jgi:hypothetical protein
MTKLVTAAAALCLLSLLFACASPVPQGPPPTPAKTYTRPEFDQLVLGKTPEELQQLLGPPSQTTTLGKMVIWNYDRDVVAITDPANGKTDRTVQIVFKNGKVQEANH